MIVYPQKNKKVLYLNICLYVFKPQYYKIIQVTVGGRSPKWEEKKVQSKKNLKL
jgi:hypothetical protein